MPTQYVALAALFMPLAAAVTYMDVRYRRIPNKFVLMLLVGGVIINTLFGGTSGLTASVGGLALAFGLMLFLHAFGTMGAGDVKLFAAIGAVIGSSLVLPTLILVALIGAALAICKMIYSGRTWTTLKRVFHFFYGLLPGERVPRFEVPVDRRHTLPYAVPICCGSVVAFLLFGA